MVMSWKQSLQIPLTVWLLISTGWFVVASELPQDADRAGQAARAQRLVAQLESSSFAARERAVGQLAQLGDVAVPALAAAARSGRHELAARSVHALTQLAVVADPCEDGPALTELMRLARSDAPTAAASAADAIRELAAVHRGIAIKKLLALGATLERPDYELGQQLLPSMMTLRLDEEYRGGAEGLKYVRWLEEVEQVALSGRCADDAWLKEVAQMPNVVSVVVRGGAVSAQGLKHFAPRDGRPAPRIIDGPPGLRRLVIFYSQLTEADVDAIAKIETLSEVRLYGVPTPLKMAAKLKQAMPAVQIDIRGGGFLGVQCTSSAEQCVVQSVHPDTAASRAGLHPGDVIRAYEGAPVEGFETLVKLISQNQAGDAVKIRFSRGGKEQTVTATLGAWR